MNRFAINLNYIPLLVTISLFVLMFGLGSVFYQGFFSPQVFLNLFIDNAFLCIVATGMTFVIISGGIDLSVGSVVALTTMVSAALLETYHWNPFPVLVLVLAMGASLGCVMGCLIHFFKLQPFIVTLAGMFLARQRQRVDDAIEADRLPPDPPQFGIEKPQVEFGVVDHQLRVADERHQIIDHAGENGLVPEAFGSVAMHSHGVIGDIALRVDEHMKDLACR